MKSKETAPSAQNISINYCEVYNLVGRLLTLVDATYTDQQQRDAHKTLVKQAVYGWTEDQYEAQYPDYRRPGRAYSPEGIA